ncbi:ester cyclase [Novosphingobium lentum]|uniref:ester cyclase n=1 Tax=Novosphingobium lentum TaxID=145287 RepID=UPI0008306D44|nr:ester cyclase [Novosphingobium lentum]
MNRDWAQYWINLFSSKTDELMSLYSPEIHFEDVNFGLTIDKDLGALRGFFENFVNPDRSVSYNDFDVFDYVGDNRLGSFQWTWETKHAGDFLGVPAAGKVTKTRGVTVMGWDENGKIVLERSIWDAIPVMQQLGAIPA